MNNDTEISSLPSSELRDGQQGSWDRFQPIPPISWGRKWTSTVTSSQSGKEQLGCDGTGDSMCQT